MDLRLVHHAKKGASRARGGQALRGSSEFHADELTPTKDTSNNNRYVGVGRLGLIV